jgi:hypothetical protein
VVFFGRFCEKPRVERGVFDGVIVVNCMVNVVFKHHGFGAPKNAPTFSSLFLRSPLCLFVRLRDGLKMAISNSRSPSGMTTRETNATANKRTVNCNGKAVCGSIAVFSRGLRLKDGDTVFE